MSKNPISKTNHKNFTVNIYYDNRDANNPVVNKLNKGIVGYLPYVENFLKINVLGNLALNEDAIKLIEESKDYVSLPVCLVETESGYGLSICRTDCQRYGIIYNLKENLNIFQNTEDDNYLWAEEVFTKEIKLFSDYVEGRVYGYEIINNKEVVIDSCWGYIGTNEKEVLEEAVKLIDNVYTEEWFLAKNKKNFAKEIAIEYNISTDVAQKIVAKVFDQVIDKIVKEGRLELRNFGVFKSVRRKARKARNPRNGKEHLVPARHYVRFKPGKALIEKITEYNLMQNPQKWTY